MKPYSERYLEKIIRPIGYTEYKILISECQRYGRYIKMETESNLHPEAWDRISALDELKQMATEDNL